MTACRAEHDLDLVTRDVPGFDKATMVLRGQAHSVQPVQGGIYAGLFKISVRCGPQLHATHDMLPINSSRLLHALSTLSLAHLLKSLKPASRYDCQ